MKNLNRIFKNKGYWETLGLLSVMFAFMLFAASPVAAQTIPTGQPARFGAIVAWVFRLAYATCAIIGAFYIIKAIMMFSNTEKGAGVKAIGGVALMIVSTFVGIAVEISQGNLPDIGLGDLMT